MILKEMTFCKNKSINESIFRRKFKLEFYEREDAVEILDMLRKRLEESENGFVTIYDLYSLACLPTNYAMNSWGWLNLEDCLITRNGDNWILEMPKANKIRKANSNEIPMLDEIVECIHVKEFKDEYMAGFEEKWYTLTLVYTGRLFTRERRYRLALRKESEPITYNKWVKDCKYEFAKEIKYLYATAIYVTDQPATPRLQGTRAEIAYADEISEFKMKKEETNMPYKNFDTSLFEKCFIIDARDIMCKVPKIAKIETYNDRVVKVTFADGTFTKAVCAVNDIFDIDVGITVCVMKKMLGKDGSKIYNNMIRDCHKLMNEQENKKIEMKMLKEEIKDKQRKDEEKRKAGKQKAREEQIDIQKEAFIRALQETGMVNNGR